MNVNIVLSRVFGFFALLLLVGCENEPEIAIPLVQTGPVSNITEDGALFNGHVSQSGDANSTVGFVWSVTENPRLENAAWASLSEFSDGAFSVDIAFDLQEDLTYYVRAYGKNGSGIIYGESLAFESKGCPAPLISSFQPTQGGRGTTIIITGEHFSNQPLHLKCFLGGAPLELLEASATSLTVKIPDNFPLSGKLPFTVEAKQGEVTSASLFTVEGSAITSLQPQVGVMGDTIRISGIDFAANPHQMNVKFGTVTATIIGGSETYLDVIIPDMAAGMHSVAVVKEGVSNTAANKIEIRNPWTLLGGIPEELSHRTASVALAIGDDIYYGMGAFENGATVMYNDLWKFSPGTGTWTRLADFPGPLRYGVTAFTINGKAYIGMGHNLTEEPMKDFWEYDPQTNQWTQKANLPGFGRVYAVSFALGDKAYVGLGSNNYRFGNYQKDFWEYTPATNTWKKLQDFPGIVRGGGWISFQKNGKGYFGGGGNSSVDPVYQKDLWQYDPVTDAWTQKNNLPFQSDHQNSTAVATEKSVYLIGGWRPTSTLNNCWEYQMQSDTWVARAAMPTPLFAAAGFSVGEKMYALGGKSSTFGFFNGLLIYNPKP